MTGAPGWPPGVPTSRDRSLAGERWRSSAGGGDGTDARRQPRRRGGLGVGYLVCGNSIQADRCRPTLPSDRRDLRPPMRRAQPSVQVVFGREHGQALGLRGRRGSVAGRVRHAGPRSGPGGSGSPSRFRRTGHGGRYGKETHPLLGRTRPARCPNRSRRTGRARDRPPRVRGASRETSRAVPATICLRGSSALPRASGTSPAWHASRARLDRRPRASSSRRGGPLEVPTNCLEMLDDFDLAHDVELSPSPAHHVHMR